MKVAVLLSGGLDSSTALCWAHAEHEVVCAVSFHYGSNHAVRELACARWQAVCRNIPYREIDITAISPYLKSALLEGEKAIPKADYGTDNMKQTVVPFRNGIFLSIAAAIAESAGAQGIVIAAHAGDHALYPDCREDFMQSMSEAIGKGTYAHLEILRPFIHATKEDIVRYGAQHRLDFSHTYSCYCGGEKHCGQCATCRERREAFRLAGVQDPTEYTL